MAKFTLARGIRVIIESKEHRILRRLPDKRIQFECIDDGELRTLSDSEVLAKYVDNQFAFVSKQDPDGKDLKQALACKLERDLAAISAPLRAYVKRCLEYVKAVDRAALLAFTRERVEPIVRRVAKKLNDSKPPSWTSVWRWRRNYVLSGRDPRALVPALWKRGNTECRFPSEVVDAARQARDATYMDGERKSIADVKARLVVLLDEINRFRAPANKLPYPGQKFITKIIQEIPEYDRMAARYGQRAADIAFRSTGRGPRPTRPLERVEMDHTKADLFVIDDKTLLPLGRPWITVCLDIHTKCVLGFFIGFEPPSTLSVMCCLKHAILPKTYVKTRYPQIAHSWGCYGTMELLVFDNAPEFHSEDLEVAALELGIDIQYAKTKVPWFKGSVERFQRTLNHDLLHGQPGTTFSNIFERDEYDSAKHAVITMGKLDEMMHQWIIDMYHQGPQGKGKDEDTPAHRWDVGILKYPVALPGSAAELDAVLGKSEERVLQHYGVELFEGLYFNSDAVGAIRRRHGVRVKTIVKYNPRDLAHIHVRDPETEQYIQIPSTDPEYTTGLSAWAHRVIVRYVKKSLGERVDKLALLRARDAIRQIVERGLKRSRNETRQRHARFQGADNSDALAAQASAAAVPTDAAITAPLIADQSSIRTAEPNHSSQETTDSNETPSAPVTKRSEDDEETVPEFETDLSLLSAKE